MNTYWSEHVQRFSNMQETKDSMMMSAADAVLGEARKSRLDETSKELEDQV